MEKKSIEKLLEKGYDFDIEIAFRKAWEMFSQNAINSVAYSLLILSVQLLVATYVPELTLVYSIFLFPALVGGFFLVANKISQGEGVVYPDFFQGFQYYITLVLINLVGQVLVALGIMVLIIPGMYLLVGYMFSFLIAIFAGTDFWQSLELSRKLIHKRWWKFFILFLVLLVLNVVAALPALLGLLVSLPLSMYVIYNVFEMVTENVYDSEE
ncbi:hypothetical protein [Litoribacter populi]|uniref:hypothetical protein n=1 Tax=Litoribacter populi TaxID=2598460 RepID=UPI00117EE58E|nr:hypothetical protein [Litoribacter populi]